GAAAGGHAHRAEVRVGVRVHRGRTVLRSGEVQGIGKILRFTGDVWKDHACCVTVVTERFLQEQPEVAAAALAAVVATQVRILEGRDAAASALSEGGYLPQPLEAIRLTLADEQDPQYVTSGAIEHP